MKLPHVLTFVDIETTGFSANVDRIIEIAAFRVEDGQITNTLHTVVDPQVPVPQDIVNMTGITPQELQSAPTFYQIAKEVLMMIEGSVFVAHNVRFDYSFLRNEFSRLGYEFKTKQLCTAKLSRSLYPEHRKHDLSSVIDRFGFNCQNRHRAYDDALVLWEFYQHISRSFPQEHLEISFDKIMKRPSIPMKLTVEDLDTLPESPGVYLFYGVNNIPLYVGKSVNIRDRVLSHFSADYASSTEMKIAQQVERIETVKTVGELGALLLESDLIKKLQPLYNRMQRHARQLVSLTLGFSKDGYRTVSLETISDIDADTLDQLGGLFKSKQQAKQYLIKLAEQDGLCEKLLGLEKCNDACFGHRLGRCSGACVGKEPTALYNHRFEESVKRSLIKRWPYPGPIAIEERNPDALTVDLHIVDKWCYLGTIKFTDDHAEPLRQTNYVFDLDMYKILSSYLLNPKHRHKIKLLSSHDLQQLELM